MPSPRSRSQMSGKPGLSSGSLCSGPMLTTSHGHGQCSVSTCLPLPHPNSTSSAWETPTHPSRPSSKVTSCKKPSHPLSQKKALYPCSYFNNRACLSALMTCHHPSPSGGEGPCSTPCLPGAWPRDGARLVRGSRNTGTEEEMGVMRKESGGAGEGHKPKGPETYWYTVHTAPGPIFPALIPEVMSDVLLPHWTASLRGPQTWMVS